jgi:hypothetical protein
LEDGRIGKKGKRKKGRNQDRLLFFLPYSPFYLFTPVLFHIQPQFLLVVLWREAGIVVAGLNSQLRLQLD